MAGKATARPGGRATSSDVAREAGVSRATVSFVLNGTKGQTISETTRQRVLEAAARLHYSPSAEARTLSRGRSDVVLLYQPPQLPLTDLGALVEFLAEEFAAIGLTAVIHPWSRKADGDVWTAITPVAVVAWDLSDRDVAAMRRDGVRAVVSLTAESDPVAQWIWGARENSIARLQVERLLRAGHRRIGYARPHDERLAEASEMRLQALRRACAEHGVPAPVALDIPRDEAGAQAAVDAVATWREMAVTGVGAHDDVAALAVLAGLREHGLTAPADLAVIGAVDSPAARLAAPPLTMVAVDMRDTARHLVEAVTSLLEGRPVPAGPEVTRVIERGSV
ncbi:LacI family DNA-binding transcriptional regulator [Streptomyces griseiscabiei]|uniref:LacI family DNA-binding transcriptional regulator n=1 Tax=Streptomyces griseiscabiei TaxID=2993540 RepID=A0ABU4L6C5_9ACTN|nr:LacI family DNA-binding transcriptional regulator [Streptomyces griseiscabiei]MBZ3906305.1 LacI family DNA-binding transcriptional regulator [Streptomyces griseiscabiei]MDX2911302.1 LacI family DNA-binding transcriptional regulator [Streptomyces griseiscabiei]